MIKQSSASNSKFLDRIFPPREESLVVKSRKLLKQSKEYKNSIKIFFLDIAIIQKMIEGNKVLTSINNNKKRKTNKINKSPEILLDHNEFDLESEDQKIEINDYIDDIAVISEQNESILETNSSENCILYKKKFKKKEVKSRDFFIFTQLKRKIDDFIKNIPNEVEEIRNEYDDMVDVHTYEDFIVSSSWYSSKINLFESSDTREFQSDEKKNFEFGKFNEKINFNEKFSENTKKQKIDAFCKLIEMAHMNEIIIEQERCYSDIFYKKIF